MEHDDQVARTTARLTDQLQWKLALENPTTVSSSEVADFVADEPAIAEAAMVCPRRSEYRLKGRRRVRRPLSVRTLISTILSRKRLDHDDY